MCIVVVSFFFSSKRRHAGYWRDWSAAVCSSDLYATRDQRERWLPGLTSGELLAAIAMTEPSAGSDLAGIRTRATRRNGGYVVNGAKTFISAGINSDLVITVVRTNPDERSEEHTSELQSRQY